MMQNRYMKQSVFVTFVYYHWLGLDDLTHRLYDCLSTVSLLLPCQLLMMYTNHTAKKKKKFEQLYLKYIMVLQISPFMQCVI